MENEVKIINDRWVLDRKGYYIMKKNGIGWDLVEHGESKPMMTGRMTAMLFVAISDRTIRSLELEMWTNPEEGLVSLTRILKLSFDLTNEY